MGNRSPAPSEDRGSEGAELEKEKKRSFPPSASSSGKKYYAFESRHGGPAVVAGQAQALEQLGGTWFGKGKAPQGFSDLESAVAHLHRQCSENQIVVRW